MDEINKMESGLVNAIRESTAKLQHELGFNHHLAIAQTILLALILWRVW